MNGMTTLDNCCTLVMVNTNMVGHLRWIYDEYDGWPLIKVAKPETHSSLVMPPSVWPPASDPSKYLKILSNTVKCHTLLLWLLSWTITIPIYVLPKTSIISLINHHHANKNCPRIIPVQDDALSDLEVVHDELLKDPSVHFLPRLALLVYTTVLILRFETFITRKKL